MITYFIQIKGTFNRETNLGNLYLQKWLLFQAKHL